MFFMGQTLFKVLYMYNSFNPLSKSMIGTIYYYHHHFTDAKTKVQRVTCQGYLPSKSPTWNSSSLASKPEVSNHSYVPFNMEHHRQY